MNLSPAQLRILAATASGLDNAEAGRAVGRSVQTVKATLTSIRAALGALNTIHAVALMDDHRPGWRPRLPIPARPLEIPDPGALGFATGDGVRTGGTFPARPWAIPARPHGFVRPESGPRRAGH